jgi:hypothetical protein
MVINIDKTIDNNIVSITANGLDCEKINIVTTGSMGWVIDDDQHVLTMIGSADVQVKFKSAEAMDIYLKQIEYDLGFPYNPFVKGINKDPHYDKVPTGNIVPHTYSTTDVEKDLLEGKTY